LFAVGFGLDVLVAVLAFGNNYLDLLSVYANEKAVLASFDPSDRLPLAATPTCFVGINPANIKNSLVWIVSVLFAYALHFISRHRDSSTSGKSPTLTRCAQRVS
jgi:hypothetical protein